VVDSLSPAECDLLSARLAALARSLEPGLARLNWNSRGIDDFVGKANAAVHDFQVLVNQVGRAGAMGAHQARGGRCLRLGQVSAAPA
jgi:hypothetical protein